MSLRAAATCPLGLALLGPSLALAAAMAWLPALAPWSGRAGLMALLGLAVYGVAVGVLCRTRPAISSSELRELRSTRQAMARMLADRREVEGGGRTAWTPLLSEAVGYLDHEIEPDLRRLVWREQGLAGLLASYERGKLHLPEPDRLKRLQELHAAQRRTVEVCVQQAANAHADLVLLLQEGDGERIAERASTWADDLRRVHDQIVDINQRFDVEPESKQIPEFVPAPVRPAPPAEEDLEGLVPLVEEALRRLNRSELAECELVQRVPHTLAAWRARWGDAARGEATSLEQGRALREVFVEAIERLKPAGYRPGAGPAPAGQALHYHIVHERYVLERPVANVVTRHNISDRTLFRERERAVRSLARELLQQEELYRQAHGLSAVLAPARPDEVPDR